MFKNASKIAVIFVVALLLVGCSGGPGTTVEKFFRAIDSGEIDEALGYLSNSTIQSLGVDKWRALLVEGSREMANEGGLQAVNAEEELVNGDIAQVTVSIEMGNGSADTEAVDLIKEDGNWKILIDPWSK